jgi:EmrB/QacA subfamily drug resistance transporter
MTRRERNVALLVAGCFFMEMLDGTIVTTAAPKIGSSLGVATTSVGLVITAYLVTLAVLIPASGWVSARFGARPVFLAAIAIFTVASLGCALAPSLPVLVAMRVLQGVGGAMMVPVGRLVILARAPKEELMRVVSFLIWPALVAPVFAPLVGGVLTTYLSWHWIFLINLPLGALALLLAARLIESPPQPAPGPLDRKGVLLTGLGLACLTYLASVVAEPRPNWALAIPLGVAALVLLLASVRHLLRARDPLVDLSILRIATFGATLGGSALFWLCVGAAPFLLPLLFQESFGWSPVKSGAILLFLFAGNIGIKPATTYLYGRFGFRAVLAASAAGLAATMIIAGLFTAGTPLVLVILVVLLSGIARSVGSTGYSTMVYSDVPEHRMGHANTLQATTLQLSTGLGVALGAIALRAGTPISEALGDGNGDAFTVAFLILAAFSLLATIGALRLHPSAGERLRRRAQI